MDRLDNSAVLFWVRRETEITIGARMTFFSFCLFLGFFSFMYSPASGAGGMVRSQGGFRGTPVGAEITNRKRVDVRPDRGGERTQLY